MAAIFTANIEEDPAENSWLIRLTDTVDNRVALCKSLEEFKNNIEEFGDDYGGDIEVSWSKNQDVTDKHFKEIHEGMATYKEPEVDPNEEVIAVDEPSNQESGFNPNA